MGDAILLIQLLVLGVLVIAFLAMIMIRGDHGIAEPLAEPLPSLPPVLLPESHNIISQDIQDIRFAVGLRGYQTDQVDQVLERLTTAVKDRDQQITDLQKQVQRQQHQSTE